jgi:hypothetical protein
MTDHDEEDDPLARHKRASEEHEARVRYAQEWLDGKVRLDPATGPRPIEIEVGEKRDPYEPQELGEGPGLTIIASEDDGMAERRGSYTVLTPGRRKSSTEEYQRRR